VLQVSGKLNAKTKQFDQTAAVPPVFIIDKSGAIIGRDVGAAASLVAPAAGAAAGAPAEGDDRSYIMMDDEVR
jgi:hypothetical protein